MTENLRSAFAQKSELSFMSMTQGQTRYGFLFDEMLSLFRRVAAACLFEVLVLATDGAISVAQSKPYDDIAIKATSAFPVSA